MRLASWRWGGRNHVGTVSSDGQELTPLACEQASRGVLPLSVVELRAPLPRRGLFCDVHNDRAHAQEVSTSVFRDVAQDWPMVFTKFAECVIGPFDDVHLPGAAVSQQIDHEKELALVETCSRGITLLPSDVIATGTPAGVGMGMVPPRWLQRADVVKVEIDGIGHIENRFQ